MDELLLGFVIVVLVFVSVVAVVKWLSLAKELKDRSVTYLAQTETMAELRQHLTDIIYEKSKTSDNYSVLLQKYNDDMKALQDKADADMAKLQGTYDRELSARKSSEVRVGKISENIAPFLLEWPWDPNSFRFLGNPIDGIQFNEDELVFVEVKTGKSRLGDSQKNIKDLILRGKVGFATFRINEGGCKLDVVGLD